jgi:hypothetical protein
MFVAIQEIQLKKPNKGGAYKEYKVGSGSFHIGSVAKTFYTYYPNYDAGRFERSHREAYKISVHQSYRENGKPKARQCVVATIGYYTFAEDGLLYDYVESGLEHAAAMFGTSEGMYDLVEANTAPLIKKIQKEYRKTEEYKTVSERDKIQKQYKRAKEAFATKYGVNADEYDYCYDIFGHVMEPDYLEEIIKRAQSYSSYSNSSSGNYSYGSSSSGKDYSSYFKTNSSNYTDEEKQTLKKFYKKLAMEFHPDRNPDADTTKEMQLLNKLKEDWNL